MLPQYVYSSAIVHVPIDIKGLGDKSVENTGEKPIKKERAKKEC